MTGDELCKILCRLEMGMTLTVSDLWLERMIAGTRQQRAERIQRIAQDYCCTLRYGIGVHIFEKPEFPRTG